ncbi:MAG: uridine kinase family protein [Anaerolineae bacterium]
MTRPLLVGIAGGTASGKSTLCEALCQALDEFSVHILHMDAYFLPVKPRTTAPYTGTEWDDYNQPGSFDLDALRRDVDALRSGERPPDVILIEGLMTLQDAALREKLDLRIFVDAPPDERIVRRLRRNMARGLTFEEIASYYLESVRWRHQEYVEPSRWHADLVYNGLYPSATGLEVIAAWIRARVSMLRQTDTPAASDHVASRLQRPSND